MNPKDISEFKDAILASEEIQALVQKELGKDADEKWAVFQGMGILDELYEMISDNGTYYGDVVSELEGAGPHNDTFAIQIWRIGPLFFVTANEFDPLEYFGSLKEAEDYAWSYFGPYIDALSEREQEEGDGWTEIASADDDVSAELLDWSGLQKIWKQYHLRKFDRFQDLANRSKHVIISRDQWGGDSPGLSGVWQTATTDNEADLRKDLRALVAGLIWENREQIHEHRRVSGQDMR
ncbi:MAG: hypothetical protein WCK17_13315 [Verrucomicrobiota bacterium]